MLPDEMRYVSRPTHLDAPVLRGIVQFCGEESMICFIVKGCALAKQLCRLSWVALLGVGLLASVCQPVTASLSQGTNGGTVSTNSDQPPSSLWAPIRPIRAAVGPSKQPVIAADQIETLIRNRLSCENLRTTIVDTGRITGLASPITLVHVDGDGCSGGSATPDDLVGVYRRDGLPELATSVVSRPREVKFSNGFAIVRGLELGPRDPRCCATIQRTTRLKFAGGKLVEVR